MRSINQRKNKKPIIILAGSVLLLGGALAYLVVARPFDKQSDSAEVTTRPINDVDYSPPSEEEVTTAQEEKDKIIQTVETQPSDDIVVFITRADQADAGQPLNIRAQIDGVTSGNCQITLTKAGQPTVAKTFTIAFEVTSGRCVDADIPASEFSQAGEWNLRVVIESGSKQSKPIEQSVTIAK